MARAGRRETRWHERSDESETKRSAVRGNDTRRPERVGDEPGPPPVSRPVQRLQRSYGNRAIQRLVGGWVRQSPEVGRPDDEYEREAGRLAEAFPHRPVTDGVSMVGADRRGGLDSDVTSPIRRPSRTGSTDTVPPVVDDALGRPGHPLDAATRASMEGYFGYDLGGVRVHRETRADDSARAIDARAYTVGHDVVFRAGEYTPGTPEGQRLIAHELTHVVQQSRTGPRVQRQPAEEGPRIDHAEANRANARYAERLWGERLGEYRPEWAELWNDDRTAFAEAVAAFQVERGLRSRDVDGVLGPTTWAMLRPFGESVVEHRQVSERARQICYEAARERLEVGYRRKTRERLPISGEQRGDFNTILRSVPVRLLQVDERYRGTGAAGAMVYLGLAEFVDQEDIWTSRTLQPGAPLQVWGSRRGFERLRDGENVHPFGTSAVFLRYEGEDRMRVLHFDREEVWGRNRFEVWIGANLVNEPRTAEP